MALIYTILDLEDRIPILTATTIDKVEKLLNEYIGLGIDKTVEYIGFFQYDSKYGDIYEGYYEYKTEYGQEKFIRYCMSIDELN
jgi:hypothetical protein